MEAVFTLGPYFALNTCPSIMNYMDDWLVLAKTEQEHIAHRSLLLCQLEWLGLKTNLAKSFLSPNQLV